MAYAGIFSDLMDNIIEDIMGESCTLKTYVDSTDTDGYLDADTTATESTVTAVIWPLTEQEKDYLMQGDRVVGDLRAALPSSVSIDLVGARHYILVDSAGTEYEIVGVDDSCRQEGSSTGVDVFLRRRDI